MVAANTGFPERMDTYTETPFSCRIRVAGQSGLGLGQLQRPEFQKWAPD
jgi:hypothetical protein